MPSITNFMTCEPASNVPDHPNSATFQASGPWLTRNSETTLWLPGGRNSVKSCTNSSKLALPPMRVVASATAINSAGKKARKRLNAMACEIMLQRGKTRVNRLYPRFTIPAKEIIAGHYTCRIRAPAYFSRRIPRVSTVPGHAPDRRE